MVVATLLLATLVAQRPLPDRLAPPNASAAPLILDRSGQPLQLRYDGDWNHAQQQPLQRIPPLLRAAVVGAEDRHFWTHHGVDWRARAAAVWQNLRAGRGLRGASTISEQVVRLLHPRPRTLWSRWVEGFEAMRLDARFSKSEILEFYLNQVPYGANRRGVAQAARYYFGRSLDTLAPPEMLALAVLLRAPSRLAREPEPLAVGITRLASHLAEQGSLPVNAVDAAPALTFARAPADLHAAHFAAAVQARAASLGLPQSGPLPSSLDAALQADAARYLEERLRDLRGEGAAQGALLVVDLERNRVRAWAVADTRNPQTIGIDAVTAPRQPGSALKPLLYALAFEQGWGPDTRIDDAPLAERVNHGLHEYRNYSRTHYGELSVREALGNSLNIPAVKTLQFVGAASFLDRLHALGVASLDRDAAIYGDGLALGNGELTLYELVQAYSALAREGRWLPLTLFEDEREPRSERALIAAPAARAISDILSDPAARQLEFGDGGVLRFPALTAVKTGTSSDYRDAWTVAYDGAHLIGVWIGDLSGRATDGVTGARGPALLARSLLARIGEPVPVAAERPAPPAIVAAAAPRLPDVPQLVQPYDGLQLARDPRIPDALEAVEFELAWVQTPRRVRWYVDGALAGESTEPRWPWPLLRGEHVLYASVDAGVGDPLVTEPVRFAVR
ncbi:MAG: transglycosylase domain-containing protein [Sinimarinibacterium sp.]|jgi:penicillin-binding protein 1C